MLTGEVSVGFNSTSQRFSYLEKLHKNEQPGPGSYHNEDIDTIASAVKPDKRVMINQLSSTG